MPLIPQIHIDRALTNISRAVVNSELVAPRVWPIVPVRKDTDKYFRYDQSNLRPDETFWASRTKAREINWGVTQKAYATERHALSQLIEDDEKQNQDSPIDVMADTTSIITEKMMIRREKRLATVLQAAATYPANHDVTLAAGDQWNEFTAAGSDPNDDVATARKQIFSQIGFNPNLMLIPREVFEKLREHPLILDRIKYTQTGVVTAELLATLFDIQNVIVTGALENTANEGQADSLGFIWGKNVYIGWVTGRAALRSPSWGYHLQSQNMVTERWRDDERRGDMIRVSYKDVPELVTPAAGYIIRSAIA